MIGRSAFAAAVLCAAMIASARTGHAQPETPDAQRSAAAQALFDQAMEARRAGRMEEACSKLEEVVRLEPRGVGARLKLAECYEGMSRFASAWATYLAAETVARGASDDARAAVAHDRADQLKPRLSLLTIILPDELKKRSGWVVLRDDLAVGRAQLGSGLPIDGGAHSISVTVDGTTIFQSKIDVKAEGDLATVEVPLDALSKIPVAPPPEAPLHAKGPRDVTPPPHPIEGGHVPVWAWAVGATGLAFAITAAALRIDAELVEQDQLEACGQDLASCPATFDVDGTNRHKYTSFAVFVGFGAASVALLGASVIGIAVGLSKPAAKMAAVVPWFSVDARGFAAGAGGAW